MECGRFFAGVLALAWPVHQVLTGNPHAPHALSARRLDAEDIRGHLSGDQRKLAEIELATQSNDFAARFQYPIDLPREQGQGIGYLILVVMAIVDAENAALLMA